MRQRLVWFMWVVVALLLIFPSPVYADSCGEDPWNAAVCMRTPIVRPVIMAVVAFIGTACSSLAVYLTNTRSAKKPTVKAQPGPFLDPQEPFTNVAVLSEAPTSASQPINVLESIFHVESSLVRVTNVVDETISTYGIFKDRTDILQKILDESNLWRKHPSKRGAEEYIRKIREVNHTRKLKIAGSLGKASWDMNVSDALNRAYKVIRDEHIQIPDSGQKNSNPDPTRKPFSYLLATNPVAGLINSIIGGATTCKVDDSQPIEIGGITEQYEESWERSIQKNLTPDSHDQMVVGLKSQRALSYARVLLKKASMNQISGEEARRQFQLFVQQMTGIS
jgi:hypothetical protein